MNKYSPNKKLETCLCYIEQALLKMQKFLFFSAGTSKFVVWHWFDERCPNNLHDDLMNT